MSKVIGRFGTALVRSALKNRHPKSPSADLSPPSYDSIFPGAGSIDDQIDEILKSGVAPPYEVVERKIPQILGSGSISEKGVEIVSGLSISERAAIKQKGSGVEKEIQKIPPQEFKAGLEKYLESPDAEVRLALHADEATKNCKEIERVFNRLAVEIGKVDSNPTPAEERLLPRFEELQN